MHIGCYQKLSSSHLKSHQFYFQMQALTTFVIWIPMKCLFIVYVPTVIDFYTEYDRFNAALNAAIIRVLFVVPDALNMCSYYTNSTGILEIIRQLVLNEGQVSIVKFVTRLM